MDTQPLMAWGDSVVPLVYGFGVVRRGLLSCGGLWGWGSFFNGSVLPSGSRRELGNKIISGHGVVHVVGRGWCGLGC